MSSRRRNASGILMKNFDLVLQLWAVLSIIWFIWLEMGRFWQIKVPQIAQANLFWMVFLPIWYVIFPHILLQHLFIIQLILYLFLLHLATKYLFETFLWFLDVWFKARLKFVGILLDLLLIHFLSELLKMLISLFDDLFISFIYRS